ncbi:MAG TPA: mechanosensitive ion channel domain-containing protein [Thermoanaerobaculia bacterium]
MERVLDYQLFRIGETSVTVASLAASLVLAAGAYLLGRLARHVVANRLLSRTHLSAGLRYAIGRFVGYLIFFLGAAAALQTLGINATTLAAFGAAVGVGVGFGLQDIVKNFVAGLVILIERPIQVGDRVEIGELAGDVVEIRARATVVRTNDDVFLIVPNSRFISETVVNRSFASPRVRCRVRVGVSYGSVPREVEAALLAAAARCDGVLSDPAPSVRFRGFGDSSLDFELLCWTDTMLHRPGALASRLNYLVHEALTAGGIEIPVPQRDLHIRTAEGLAGLGAMARGGTESAAGPRR